MSRQSESPIPDPFMLLSTAREACAKRSKIIPCLSFGMPMPVSRTVSVTLSSSSRSESITSIRPPLGVNFSALDKRL